MKLLDHKVIKLSQVLFYCGLLLFIGMIGFMAMDMYVPSMPFIAKDFAINTTLVRYTISIYLASYAVGILFYGPLSDSVGRKPVLLSATIIGTLGSVMCMFAPNIVLLNIGRLLQGIGYAGISVIAPVIARDIFDDKLFAQVASVISLAFGLGPIVSPVIGGYLDHLFGWRSVFEVMSVYSTLILLVVIFVIPETHCPEHRTRYHFKEILKTWQHILSNHVFKANAIGKSFVYTGFIVFYAVTPFMFQDHLGFTSVQFGWVTLSITGVIVLSKFLNTIALSKVRIETIILYSFAVIALSGIFLFILSVMGVYSVAGILIPFIFFGLGSGFLFPNATVVCYQPFKSVSSGSVSALLTGMQMIFAFIGSAIAAHLPVKTMLPLGVFLGLLCGFAFLQYLYFTRSSK